MSFDEEPAVVLLCVPDDAVAFDGAGAGSLALTNLSRASCVCFRVQATDTQLEAAPSDGVLPPGKQVQVRLRLTAAGAPERVIVRYALLPQNCRGVQVSTHLDSLRDAWGSDARHCQHLLRATRGAASAEADTASSLIRTVTGGGGARERLAAAERLALLRSVELLRAEEELLKAQERISALEEGGGGDGGGGGGDGDGDGDGGGGGGAASKAPREAQPQRKSSGPSGRVVRSTGSVLALVASHLVVGAAAALAGAVYADAIIGV